MKIDKIDNKLIVELLNNCRKTNVQLGKKVGLSREGVANRIRKLEEAGIITGFGININFSRLGFIPHEVSIKLQKMDTNREKEIFDFVKSEKKIIFAERALGKFDLVIMLMVKSLAELDEEMEKIRKKIGGNIKDISVWAWIANYDTASSFFTSSPESKISRHSVDAQIYKLDKKEKELLAELALNSRESAVELSKKIGISEITVASKIRLLSSNGVIKCLRAGINFEKLGLNRYVVLLNASSNIETRLAGFCKDNRLIADFTKFSGEYNYSIEVLSANNEEFEKVVGKLLNSFSDSIISYETLIMLEELKHISFYV